MEAHDAAQDGIEKAWWERFASREHDGMSQTLSFLAHDASKTMWTDSSCTESSARADAAEYKRKYHADAQFIFSRVQHHVHKKTKNGYVPLAKGCVSKSSKGLCKHGFPKVKQLNMKRRVVCSGNAMVCAEP